MNIKWNEYTWYSRGLAALFFIFVLPVWAFYMGMQYQKTVNVLEPLAQDETATGATGVYTDTQYGFSFRYPLNSQVVKGKNYLNYGDEQLPGYTFEYGPNGSIWIDVVRKDNFYAETKVGIFNFASACFHEAVSGDPLVLQKKENTGMNTAYLIGGSQMSDPAYYDYAVLTDSTYMLIVRATYNTNLQDPILENTIKSIQFKEGIRSVESRCN